MDGIAGIFNSLGLFYLIGAGFTVYQLARGWRAFWDEHVTPHDAQVAGGVAFFLILPIGVLLHEIGHVLAAWQTGGQVLGLNYYLYWGYVTYLPASDAPMPLWYVSLAGNAVSYFVGIACMAAALLWTRGRAVLRLVLLQAGILQLAHTLIFYPLMSLDPAFQGDWDTIYSFDAPFASAATLALHALSLLALVLVLRNRRVSQMLRS